MGLVLTGLGTFDCFAWFLFSGSRLFFFFSFFWRGAWSLITSVCVCVCVLDHSVIVLAARLEDRDNAGLAPKFVADKVA